MTSTGRPGAGFANGALETGFGLETGILATGFGFATGPAFALAVGLDAALAVTFAGALAGALAGFAAVLVFDAVFVTFVAFFLLFLLVAFEAALDVRRVVSDRRLLPEAAFPVPVARLRAGDALTLAAARPRLVAPPALLPAPVFPVPDFAARLLAAGAFLDALVFARTVVAMDRLSCRSADRLFLLVLPPASGDQGSLRSRSKRQRPQSVGIAGFSAGFTPTCG